MKRVGSLLLALLSLHFAARAQTCTITGSGSSNWNNGSPLGCQEGGTTAGASVIIIPAGRTINFDSNADTWTGVRIEVNGTLRINAPGNVTINASIVVKNGGLLAIDSKLNLGTAGGCNYTLAIESGGTADIVGGSSDRLNICGTEIVRGGTGGCNDDYPNGDPSYCEPTGGFTGPTGFDEDGYNGTLPVTWLSFSATNVDNKSVHLAWSTASETNSASFAIERSSDGRLFNIIGSQEAAGSSSARRDYAFTDTSPLLGRNYYRLRQIDLDGASAYSTIRFADLDGSRLVSVYPNPADRDRAIGVRLNFLDEGTNMVRIYDLSGHEVRVFSFTGNEVSLPVELAAGCYLLRVTSLKSNLMCRFIVH